MVPPAYNLDDGVLNFLFLFALRICTVNRPEQTGWWTDCCDYEGENRVLAVVR